MPREPKIPERFPICHDEYHARHIGWTRDGRQFFVTTPFVSGSGKQIGRNFVATYLFDEQGRLVEDRIDELGPRLHHGYPPGNVDHDLAEEMIEKHIAALDIDEFTDIEIAPFQITRFGIEFGLILLINEDDPDFDPERIRIELHPGNYMAFSPPWNGDYET
jgi:hypothetical protein